MYYSVGESIFSSSVVYGITLLVQHGFTIVLPTRITFNITRPGRVVGISADGWRDHDCCECRWY